MPPRTPPPPQDHPARPGRAAPAGSRPPYRRRARPSNDSPESFAHLLPALMARIGGEDRAAEQRIALVWTEAVGPLLARHTRPEGVRGKTLLVKVTSSSYAHELVLLRREILDRITRTLGTTLVTEIRSRVGPIGRG